MLALVQSNLLEKRIGGHEQRLLGTDTQLCNFGVCVQGPFRDDQAGIQRRHFDNATVLGAQVVDIYLVGKEIGPQLLGGCDRIDGDRSDMRIDEVDQFSGQMVAVKAVGLGKVGDLIPDFMGVVVACARVICGGLLGGELGPVLGARHELFEVERWSVQMGQDLFFGELAQK